MGKTLLWLFKEGRVEFNSIEWNPWHDSGSYFDNIISIILKTSFQLNIITIVRKNVCFAFPK